MIRKPIWILIASLALLAGCTETTSTSTAPVAPVEKRTTDEVTRYVESLRGKVVLVNFWATWCRPCREEIPDLIKLQQAHGERLQIVGLSIDDADEAREVAAFVAKHKINYPIFLVGEETAQKWGEFDGIPMTFLLDVTGKKVWQHEGSAPFETFDRQVRPLLPKS